MCAAGNRTKIFNWVPSVPSLCINCTKSQYLIDYADLSMNGCTDGTKFNTFVRFPVAHTNFSCIWRVLSYFWFWLTVWKVSVIHRYHFCHISSKMFYLKCILNKNNVVQIWVLLLIQSLLMQIIFVAQYFENWYRPFIYRS